MAASDSSFASDDPVVTGNAHVYYAFDVGLQIDLDRAAERLERAPIRREIPHARKSPPYFEHHPLPLVASLACDALSVEGVRSDSTVEVTIYDFAAMSVAYRFPLDLSLPELVRFSVALYDHPAVEQHARALVGVLLDAVGPATVRPGVSGHFEDYALFHVATLDGSMVDPGQLAARPTTWAQVLRAECDDLSAQETDDALSRRLAYTSGDLLVIDWNAALAFDTEVPDVRPVLEFANVALLEMRYLDQELDDALDAAYEVFTRPRSRWSPRSYYHELRRIAELQMDNALLFENVNNALKLVGDQYLARVYRAAAERLHLDAWDASIVRKLQTLEGYYEKLAGLASNRRMEALEWIIILLITASILLDVLR